MPSGWASVFSTYSMLSTSSAVYLTGFLVVGCLGELERVIFLFQYGGFGVPTALQVTVDFLAGCKGYYYPAELLIFRLLGLCLTDCTQRDQHGGSEK